MVKAQDVMDYIDSAGSVSIEGISVKFDLDWTQSAEVLRRLWEAKLITPFSTSMFMRTPADGKPPVWQKANTRSYHRKKFKAETKLIRTLLKAQAMTVTDLMVEIHGEPRDKSKRNGLMKVLNLLVQDGTIVMRPSKYGGSYGRPPNIYGMNEDDISFRESELKQEVEEKREKRKTQFAKERS